MSCPSLERGGGLSHTSSILTEIGGAMTPPGETRVLLVEGGMGFDQVQPAGAHWRTGVSILAHRARSRYLLGHRYLLGTYFSASPFSPVPWESHLLLKEVTQDAACLS